jgi:PAS domain S-box-containing protein
MASTVSGLVTRGNTLPFAPSDIKDGGKDAHLLLQAFEMFTQASSSLESVFQHLQRRAERLSRELEAKNRELKKSLREKAEVQNYLKTILESLPCGVLVLDPSGKVALCNPMAAQILEEPQGKSLGNRRRGRELRSSAIRESMACSVAPDGQPAADVEIPVHSGGKTRILSTSGTWLADASGAHIGTLHILRDVTEVKRLEEQGKRVERLSAMGEMAVELAHEIRNPLGSIELFASLLEKELEKGSDEARWAENIRVGSRSLNNIVSNMLHFANPHAPNFTEVNLHEVIDEILRFTDPLTRQREILVELQLGAEDPMLCADRELLKQMMLNLIMNSMQAMPARGKLAVSTRDADQLPGGAPCRAIELEVRDTGLGIPSENLDRIFDPFFTTNRNGTGLGLSVVHQIVDRHSGFINVKSEVNVGTAFTIAFPSRFGPEFIERLGKPKEASATGA